ncbi:HET-domain-containing protein [Trametes sanguinea]|nr:HET-domain-containing protein [Trametes sanguinea]
MRILDTRTGHFRWIDDPERTPYAILSHTWDPEGEQSYQDLLKLQTIAPAPSHCAPSVDRPEDDCVAPPSILSDPALSAKIRGACCIARQHGYDLIWIDSCCIDKSSSAELSEAINSMFDWYRLADVCYAYLSDVSDDVRVLALDPLACRQFRQSRWHTRGWTLQELIAPKHVLFLSRDWTPFGTKASLASALAEITGIDNQVLTHAVSPESFSVAQRMSWAARRVTTRVEDRAYSLLGLFGIHMPTIYGEGRGAFLRLQEEIMKRIPDQTLFAWGTRYTYSEPRMHDPHVQALVSLTPPERPWGLLADSPEEFAYCSHVVPMNRVEFNAQLPSAWPEIELPDPTINARGILLYAPIIDVQHLPLHAQDTLHHPLAAMFGAALLRCWDNEKNTLFFLPLSAPAVGETSRGLGVGAGGHAAFSHSSTLRKARIFAYPLETIYDALKSLKVRTISVLACAHADRGGMISWSATPRIESVNLSAWCVPMLTMQGLSIQGQPGSALRARKDKDAVGAFAPPLDRFSFTLNLRNPPSSSRLTIAVVPALADVPTSEASPAGREGQSGVFIVSFKPTSLHPSPALPRRIPALSCVPRASCTHSLSDMYHASKLSWAEYELREKSLLGPIGSDSSSSVGWRGQTLRVTFGIVPEEGAGVAPGHDLTHPSVSALPVLHVPGRLTVEIIPPTFARTMLKLPGIEERPEG